MKQLMNQLTLSSRLDKAQPGSRMFWVYWAVAFLGFPLGGLASQAVVGPVDHPFSGVIAGAISGSIIGTAQWLVLRQRMALSPKWIGASAVGMAVGLGLGLALFGPGTGGVELQLRAVLTGAGIGVAQAWMLRPLARHTFPWVIGVALAWAVGWTITRAVGVDLSLAWSVFGSTGAWVFQLITGVTLAWLFKPSR